MGFSDKDMEMQFEYGILRGATAMAHAYKKVLNGSGREEADKMMDAYIKEYSSKEKELHKMLKEIL